MLKGVKPKLRNIPSTSTEDGFRYQMTSMFASHEITSASSLNSTSIMNGGIIFKKFLILFCCMP